MIPPDLDVEPVSDADCILAFGHGFESFQNAIRAWIDAHRRNVTPTNDALGIDDKQGALRLAVFLPVDAVLTGHCAFGLKIRQKRNVQFAVFAEGEMAPDTVDRDTDDLCFKLGKFRLQLAIERQLVAANGAPIRRIEDQDYGLSAKVGEGYFLIRGGRKGKVR